MTLSRVLALAAILTLTGCATTSSGPAPEPRPARAAASRPVAADRLGESYYHFSVAQMHARGGRMPEAIGELRLAIERDPKTAALWTQLAQWLARSNQPAEAVAAAQKAVELEPDSTSAYLTLAELYRRYDAVPDWVVPLFRW